MLTCIFVSSGCTSSMFWAVSGLCIPALCSLAFDRLYSHRFYRRAAKAALMGVGFSALNPKLVEDAINIYLELFASAPDGTVQKVLDECFDRLIVLRSRMPKLGATKF